MGEHIDTRGTRRKKTNESEDILARKRRVTFKNYIRELEEESLADDLDDEDDAASDLFEMTYKGQEYHRTGKVGKTPDGRTELEYESDSGARIWVDGKSVRED